MSILSGFRPASGRALSRMTMILFACCGAQSTTSSRSTPETSTTDATDSRDTPNPAQTSMVRAVERCEDLGFSARAGYRTEPVDRTNEPRMITEGQAGWVEPPRGVAIPQDVELEVLGAPEVGPTTVTLRASLVNRSTSVATVYFWDAGLGFFRLSLQGDAISQRSVPQIGPREIYPQKSMLILPAGGRATFASSIALPCWSYSPRQNATLAYALQSSSREVTGTLQVTLP